MKSITKRLAEALKEPALEKQFLGAAAINRLADAILILRKQRGLTQKQLAERVGTTQAVISRVESGSVKPSFETILKIAEALDAAIDVRFVPIENMRRKSVGDEESRQRDSISKGISYYDFENQAISPTEKWITSTNASLGNITTTPSKVKISAHVQNRFREFA
ncbi:MAG: XRE family transcriptional regulator [Acidobacteria bacterium]|nr:MAG: XRE family transcriptional regulator [Acidobacteriota bacterium]